MRRVHFWLFVLLLAALACTLDIGGPTPPPTPIGPVENARDDIRRAWVEALSKATEGDGHFAVVLSQAQLTSLLDQRFPGVKPFVFSHPTVLLRDGHIEIYGELHHEHAKMRVLLVLVPNTNSAGYCSGTCTFLLKEAEFGPWKVPEPFRKRLLTLFQNVVLGQALQLPPGVKIQRMRVINHTLLIEGQMKQ